MPVWGRPRPLLLLSAIDPLPNNGYPKILMSEREHNPSRRAVLGAAVMLPFDQGLRHAQPLLRMSGDQAPWDRALAAYRAAEADLRECERRTAGAPWAEQEAVEEEFGDRLDALYAALRRLLRASAPDVGALALKIDLGIEHEVATLNGGEACLAAIRRDAWRLARSA